MTPRWHDFQDTGHEPMEQDHRQIAKAQSRLLEAVNAGRQVEAVLILDALLDAYRDHFAHEERLMAEYAYPHAARHKETHDLFLADSERALAGLQANGLAEPFRRWVTGRFLEWFRFHIAANDVGLGRFLEARLPAAPAHEPAADRTGTSS